MEQAIVDGLSQLHPIWAVILLGAAAWFRFEQIRWHREKNGGDRQIQVLEKLSSKLGETLERLGDRVTDLRDRQLSMLESHRELSRGQHEIAEGVDRIRSDIQSVRVDLAKGVVCPMNRGGQNG